MSTFDEPSIEHGGDTPELAVTHPSDQVSVLSVNCELDMVTTPALEQLLTQELDSRPAALLLDLSGCEFMGSSGLAALLAARYRANQGTTRLALAGLTRTVRRCFAATALDPLFEIFSTSDEAMRTLTTH